MHSKFFPEYLDKGSVGPAVALLQTLLVVLGFNGENIVIDGDYGGETVIGVTMLQRDLPGVEPDGNFGPATRVAFMAQYRLDVDTLPAGIFTGVTEAVGP